MGGRVHLIHWLYFHSQVMDLFNYYDTATEQNQHQLLLTCKTSKWQSLIFQKLLFLNYYQKPDIPVKNLTKCNILKTFAPKNNEKFADHNFKKLYPLSLALASTIHVLGLKKVCPQKVGLWPWPQT